MRFETWGLLQSEHYSCLERLSFFALRCFLSQKAAIPLIG